MVERDEGESGAGNTSPGHVTVICKEFCMEGRGGGGGKYDAMNRTEHKRKMLHRRCKNKRITQLGRGRGGGNLRGWSRGLLCFVRH
jgi:hypothetical protein